MMSIGITRSKEATCFINKMNKPTKVFAYHANEAAVRQGKIVPGKRSVASIKG